MKITNKTPYHLLEPIEKALADGEVQRLKEAAVRVYGAYADLTINEFFGILEGNLEKLGDVSCPSVYQIYWVKGFADFVEQFTKSCEALTIKDPSQEGIERGCMKIEGQEAALIYLREYFRLPSFFAAGERTIGEYILARKDSYNRWKMQRNYEAKQMAKIKEKR